MAVTASAAVTPTPSLAIKSTTQSSVGATTHPIEYQIGCPPSMVDDGSLDYFIAHGFTAVNLVVPDNGTYQTELNKIKSLGMTPIIDVEQVIWQAGALQSTPITTFGPYFQSLKNAGWEYVSSEGGRSGDLAYMAQFFKGYVNYNCDQCGLWGSTWTTPPYKDSFTVMNSWESYYTSEWPYIQQGATVAASSGKQNGILAGVWEYSGSVDYNPILTNSKNGGSPSYKSMLDWSYANGIGFNHFQVWCGLNSQGLSRYKALGFEQVVADLQTYYPPTTSTGGWSNGGWGALSSLGGILAPGTGPAVCAQDANSLDVFVQGADHALWHKHYQLGSGWGNWESLGGVLTSAPAATSMASGTVNVFVRGGDGALWQKYTTDGGSHWSAWQSLGGKIASNTGPAVSSWGQGRLDVFVQGTDGALWHKAYTGASWSSWQSLGGRLTSGPSATSPASGVIDVFVRGGDGAVWHKDWNGAAWSSWASVGGRLASGTGPAASSWGSGRLDVFVQGTDGALWHKAYTGASWSNWQSLGGYLTSSPAATSSTSSAIDVFVRGGDSGLWQREYNGA